MTSLPILHQPTNDAPMATAPHRRLPRWLKRPLPLPGMAFTSDVISDLHLETVCESAKCPNRSECWSQKTATFMIAGNVCTRPCGFCSVPKGKTERLEIDEPERVAEAAARLGLKYVVITSVTRDDLPDGGAEHWYRTVIAVRERTGSQVEVLTPDFLGNRAAISRVVEARPDVFNHNTETVPRLYHRVRRNADYQRTLDLLKQVKDEAPAMPTKSGLMLGLGETREELLDVFADSTCSRRPIIFPWSVTCLRKNSTKSAASPACSVSAWSPADHSSAAATTPAKWPGKWCRKRLNST
jgi:lipoic acid synthetase